MFWRRRLDKGTLIAVVIAAIWCAGFVTPFASSLGGGSTTTALGGQDPALSAMPEGANPSADSGDAIAALAPLLDYDAASLALSNNDPVSSWPNIGSLGSDWDLANTGASTTKPTYKATEGPGGIAAVYGDTGDAIETALAVGAIEAPYWVVVVAAGDSINNRNVVGSANGSSSGVSLYYSFGGSRHSFLAGTTVSLVEAPISGEFDLFAGRSSAGSDGEVRARSSSTTGTTGNNSVDDFALFDSGAVGVSPYSGWIVRAFVVDGSVSYSAIETAVESIYGGMPQ